MALTRVDFQKTAGNTGAAQSTASMTWQANDLFVIIVGTEIANTPANTPTFSGGTFTAISGGPWGSGGTQAWGNAYSCQPVSGGSGAISATVVGGVAHYELLVWQFRSHNGTGKTTGLADAALVVSNANTGTASWVCMGMFDFAAGAAGLTGSPTVTNEVEDVNDGTHYSVWGADWQSQTGTTSYGVASDASAGPFTKVVVEVIDPTGTLGGGGGSFTPPAVRPPNEFVGPFRNRRAFVPPDLQDQTRIQALPPGTIAQAGRSRALSLRQPRAKRTTVLPPVTAPSFPFKPQTQARSPKGLLRRGKRTDAYWPSTTAAGCGAAMTITDRGYISNNPVPDIFSLTAFTPASGSYVVVVGAAWYIGSGGPMTISDNFGDSGGGTWTQILTVSHNFSPDVANVMAWYRLIGTGAGNGSVHLVSHSGSNNAMSISTMEVAGGGTPVLRTGQTITSDTSNTSVTNTLPAAVCPNGLVVTGYFDVGQFTQVNPDQSGYTLWGDASMGGDGFRGFYKNGSPDTTTSFSGLESANPNLGYAFELIGVGGAAAPAFIPMWLSTRRRQVLVRPARARVTNFVPAQLNPPYPFKPETQARDQRGWLFRRGRRTDVVPPQFNPPYPFMPQTQKRALRGWFLRRGKRSEELTDEQFTWIDSSSQRRQAPNARMAKGKRADAPYAQVVVQPTLPLPVKPEKVVRGFLRRGKRSEQIADEPVLWIDPSSQRRQFKMPQPRGRAASAPIVHHAAPPSPSGQVLTPAWKERFPFGRRGRRTDVPPVQDGPVPIEHPARQPKLPVRRGRQWNYIQAQVIIPRAPDWLMRPHRLRGWRMVRGKRIEFPTPQATAPIPQLPLPTTQKRAYRGWLFRRGKRADVVPPQQAVVGTYTPNTVTEAFKQGRFGLLRRRGIQQHVPGAHVHPIPLTRPTVRRAPMVLRRGKRADVQPLQDQPVVPMVNRPRRGLLARGRSQWMQRPVPAQVIIPRAPDWIMRPHRVRGWRLVRGKRIEFPTPQATAPIPTLPLPVLQKRAQRGWLFRRGRRADVVPPQIIVTPAYVPNNITPALKMRSYALLRRRGIQQHVGGQAVPHPVARQQQRRPAAGLLRRRGVQQHVPGQPHPIVPQILQKRPRQVTQMSSRMRSRPHVAGQVHPVPPMVTASRRRFTGGSRRRKDPFPNPAILPQPNRWKPDITSQYRALRGWVSRFGRGKTGEFVHPIVFTYISPQRADVQERTRVVFTETDRVDTGERDRASHREPDRIDVQERTDDEEF